MKLYEFKGKSLMAAMAALLLVACNSGNNGTSDPSNSRTTSYGIAANSGIVRFNTAKIDLNWTIDNDATAAGLSTDLKDLGWHLLTATVESVGKSTVATPVEGIVADLYPKPAIDMGQAVLIRDINCEQAIFSKAGDTCSVYFKLDYDTSKGGTNSVPFSVEMATKADINPVIKFKTNFDPRTSIANYRAVNSFESSYYNGSTIAANKNAYQIFLVQNGSVQPIRITHLQAPTNPAFTLVHRRVATDNDPYYADHAECALTDNQDLKQVNSLNQLNDRCMLVYSAAATSNHEQERAMVQITSDATSYFPYLASNYTLIASYISGVPIPPVSITSTSGTYHTSLPVNKFTLNYNFKPQSLPILANSNTYRLILPEGSNIWVNEPVYLGVSGLITPASKVMALIPEFQESMILADGMVTVDACDGATVSVTGNAVAHKTVTLKNAVRINLDINSNGQCGNEAPYKFYADIPLSGYSSKIYDVDQIACGSRSVDNAGAVELSGGCDDALCKYHVNVTAHNDGVTGQCKDTQSSFFDLTFPRPSTNMAAYLDSVIPTQSVVFATQGGQDDLGSIGSEVGLTPSELAALISCNSGSKICTRTHTHSSNQESQDIAYQINLNPGDVLDSGTIEFNRKFGYDLNSFTIQTMNQ